MKERGAGVLGEVERQCLLHALAERKLREIRAEEDLPFAVRFQEMDRAGG